MERTPEKKECDCTGFIGNSMELEMVLEREKRKKIQVFVLNIKVSLVVFRGTFNFKKLRQYEP